MLKLDKSKMLDQVYSEEDQTKNLYFAPTYLDKNIVYQLHPLFVCRDFFQEFWAAGEFDRDVEIYGFHSLACTPRNTNRAMFIVKYANMPVMRQNLPLLNKFEKECGLKLTKLRPLKGKKTVRFVVGDPLWGTFSHSLSIYTYFLRTLCYNTECDSLEEHLKSLPPSKDRSLYDYVTFNKFNVRLFVRNLSKLRSMGIPYFGCEDAPELGVDYIHNKRGFVSLAMKHEMAGELLMNAYKELEIT